MSSPLTDGTYALISGTKRRIGTIIPNIVIEEVSTDTMRITDHPVEIGCAITDHAYMMPKEVMMRCGWSDSSGGFEGYSEAVYAALLDLQTKREPFDVSTGQRQYKSMLIGLVHKQTNEKSEHALFCTVGMREILLTTVQMAAGTSSDPKKTDSPTTAGSTTTTPSGTVTGNTNWAGSLTPGTDSSVPVGPLTNNVSEFSQLDFVNQSPGIDTSTGLPVGVGQY